MRPSRPSATLSAAIRVRSTHAGPARPSRRSRPSRLARPPSRRTLLLVLTAALLVPGLVSPGPAHAAMTATQAEAEILRWVNDARRSRGLAPLVRSYDLAVIAGRRATRMAERNTLSHSAGGDLQAQLADRDVEWYRYGETIAYSGATWTAEAARGLFDQWRGSSSHWTLLMSDRFNYVGVGIAYRSSNRRTFGSVVLSESPDHTRPQAWVVSSSRQGDIVRWVWSGRDPWLQRHTAGLRDFDVQYLAPGGAWRTLRNDTTTTTINLYDRSRGDHSLRVRATDRRGNVGAWTTASTISVP
jgi:uncharacterized protein YkwD